MSKKEHKKTYRKRYLIIVGVVVAVVALSILLHTMLGSQPPRIISLGAWPERVLTSGSCQIVCHAADPDGGGLSYEWSASGGEISGQGATVNWTAPDSAGSYKVAVTVTDPRGGEAVSQITIAVGSPGGPVDRVDVVYFHRTQRCYTCIHAEELTRYTLETYFADELDSPKLTFQSIDVQSSENTAIVQKYGAYGSQLFINTIEDGTDHIEEATDLYPLVHTDEAFVTTLKSKIEKSLNGET